VLAYGIRQAVARLGEAVLSLRPLIDVLEHPVRVAPRADGAETVWPLGEPASGYAGVAELLNRVAARLGAPRFNLCLGTAASELGTFGRVVSNRLGLAAYFEPGCVVPVDSLPEVDQIVDEVVAQSFDRYCVCSEAISFGGVPVRAYAAGERHNKTVVIASACGMPAKLCEHWIRFLAKEYFVVTWESRGLFGTTEHFESLTYDVTGLCRKL
jgi:hypothetical protein